ncbi:MAG: hypothetical protein EOO04_13710, partial [Chitinophagaceae bacterium]
PNMISFDQLLAAFLTMHDPTQLNRQGPDIGTSYRSVAFYSNDEEKKQIEAAISKYNNSGLHLEKVVTEVKPFEVFYPAEAYHQNYYKNNGDLRFTNKQQDWGFDHTGMSSGAVYADLDNDGDLDLVISNINEEASIYRNNASGRKGSNYLSMELHDKDNRSVSGSKVNLYSNGSNQYQELNQNRGYLSAVSTRLHFGVGSSTVIDSLVIIWPDRKKQVVQKTNTNQHLTISYDPTTVEVSQPTFTIDSQNIIKKQPVSKQVFLTATDPVQYRHRDFSENDFKRQPLMLFMYSKAGPVMAKADVDNDGLEDIYISGDLNNSGFIYKQRTDGNFVKSDTAGLGNEAETCVSAATFFDANGDGFKDLYLARGGYSLFQPNSIALQDELYLNDKEGRMTLSRGALPNLSSSSKSVVRSCDYDLDGDIDLFVGGRVVPGMYPVNPHSYLLKNNGKGMFLQVATPIDSIGMITDAAWIDLDDDGRKDLVLCGEFMPVTVFLNTKQGFVNATSAWFPVSDTGFWSSLSIADVNGDGKDDIIAGNLGTNTQFKISADQPGEMYYADFDQNGSIDPFFNFYIDGKSYPFVSRDELNDQIYAMRKKFAYYKDYANATINDILPASDMSGAQKLTASECHSVCFLNNKGQFEKHILPIQAQFAPIYGMLTEDFDNDGLMDVLVAGNSYATETSTGRYDAMRGLLLKGKGNGDFEVLSTEATGLAADKDVKALVQIRMRENRLLLVANNNDKMESYLINSKNTRTAPAKLHEAYAIVQLKNGRTYKQEFYYGNNYLSQSSRQVVLGDKVQSVVFYDDKNQKRIVQ